MIKMEKKNPIVTMEMMDGDIVKLELYPEVAPNTVNNFISLIKKNFYDGVTFHRVIAGFMIQVVIRREQEQVDQDIPSKVNFRKMDSKIIFPIHLESFLWHVRWIQILRAASSLLCIKRHLI